MEFCTQAFYNTEIYENGDVYNCCPHFQHYIPLGNIFAQPFEEIWNGERAKNIRKEILNGTFSLCDPMCPEYKQHLEKPADCEESMSQYPKNLAVSSDNICNVRCRFCRENHLKSEISDEEFISKIDTSFLPIFKNAEFVRFGCSGEPFASKKEKELIKRILENYPDIKIQIFTNGILGNKETFEKYNLFGKIDSLTVSIHAATKPTYEKVVRDGNFEKLIKNLEFYSELKSQNLLNALDFVFVVYSENYTEIPAFVEFAKKYNAHPLFWVFRKNINTELGQQYDKYSVIEPTSEHYENLCKIINSTDFNGAFLAPELRKLLV